jgi:hypothetical protein
LGKIDPNSEQAQAQADAEQGYGEDFDQQEPGFEEGFSILELSDKPIPKEDILLGNRYLCVACILFIVAPSGLGKSTLAIQIAILFACGLAALGIPPARQLRVLIVQAEDDLGDCIEMARMINHLGLNEKQKRLVGENTKIIQCNSLILSGFVRALEKELKSARDQGKPWDIVIINPYSTYLGGDPKDDRLCSQFLCQLLQPVLTSYRVGAIIIHHTPKTNFQNTDNYKLWDWMYWGAGCAKITNVARAILAIKPLDDELKVFRFIAAKRGQRIGHEWERHFERYFAHSSDPNLLRWEEATAEQIAKATGGNGKFKTADLNKALGQVPVLDPEHVPLVVSKIQAACKVGEKKAKAALDQLVYTQKAFIHQLLHNGIHRGRPLQGVSRTAPSSEESTYSGPPPSQGAKRYLTAEQFLQELKPDSWIAENDLIEWGFLTFGTPEKRIRNILIHLCKAKKLRMHIDESGLKLYCKPSTCEADQAQHASEPNNIEPPPSAEPKEEPTDQQPQSAPSEPPPPEWVEQLIGFLRTEPDYKADARIVLRKLTWRKIQLEAVLKTYPSRFKVSLCSPDQGGRKILTIRLTE